ncbi:cell death regulator Aven [Scyliorhinus canicula]|uniref:cell death regulator Aven n=1 Tax=Scyliorhinus canicula TaxID=7830 RepID=UPI0018F2A94D|nr:cell death regulator Aven [Scyliorhinus canicula]
MTEPHKEIVGWMIKNLVKEREKRRKPLQRQRASNSSVFQEVLCRYKDVFQNALDRIKIYVNPDSTPKFFRARPVLYSLHQKDDDVEIKEDFDQPNEFSRRKIVSNWDRYKTEEKEHEDGDESPRGTDFSVLLSSAGDSFAQFRFAEEKEWEVEVPSSKQISPLFVDCQSLAHSLQELPLYLRLNVEAELVQITPPAELPQITLKSVHDGTSKFSQFRAQATTGPAIGVHTIPVSSAPEDADKHTFNLSPNPVVQAPRSAPPSLQQAPDKLDEELDFLLQLETPVNKSNDVFLKGAQDVEALCDPETVKISTDLPDAKVIDNTNSQPSETAKKLDPEEELEDWLDSMIS